MGDVPMQTIQQFPSWFAKQKLSGKLAIGCASLFMLCCLCSIPIAILSPATPPSTPVSTSTSVSTSTPVPTSTSTPVPEFSFNEIIQSPKEKGWTDTQYSTYFETIKGKKVNGWSGTILEIDEWGGEPYLSLDIEPNEPEIDAYVYISKDDFLKVGLGQNITFAGIIDSNWAESNNYYALQIKDVTLLKMGEIPTPTPEPPTAIPSATGTTQPTQDSYEILIVEKISEYGIALLDVTEYVQQAGNDPSLILDNDWRTKTGFAFGILNSRAEEMAKLEPSPNYVDLHSIIVKLADETYLFTDSYAKGIDNLDSAMIEKASQHLRNMTTFMQEATTEMNRIKTAP
jgi:hypothetical protein